MSQPKLDYIAAHTLRDEAKQCLDTIAWLRSSASVHLPPELMADLPRAIVALEQRVAELKAMAIMALTDPKPAEPAKASK
jgi:hypothetical protein